jgi:hypothetical protein
LCDCCVQTQSSFRRQLLGRQLGVQLDDDLHDARTQTSGLEQKLSREKRNFDDDLQRAIGSGASAATNSHNTNRTLTVPASQTRSSNKR